MTTPISRLMWFLFWQRRLLLSALSSTAGCRTMDVLTLIRTPGEALILSAHIPTASEGSLVKTFKMIKRHPPLTTVHSHPHYTRVQCRTYHPQVHLHTPRGCGLGSHVVRRTTDFPSLRRQWGLWDPERHRPSSTFHATQPRAVLHGPSSTYHNGRWRRMAQGLFGEAACGDIYTVSEAVTETTLDTMALPAVWAYLDSIGLSDPDLLMSIAETVDEWEKGIQAFEAVATCPVGTFASLRGTS